MIVLFVFISLFSCVSYFDRMLNLVHMKPKENSFAFIFVSYFFPVLRNNTKAQSKQWQQQQKKKFLFCKRKTRNGERKVIIYMEMMKDDEHTGAVSTRYARVCEKKGTNTGKAKENEACKKKVQCG